MRRGVWSCLAVIALATAAPGQETLSARPLPKPDSAPEAQAPQPEVGQDHAMDDVTPSPEESAGSGAASNDQGKQPLNDQPAEPSVPVEDDFAYSACLLTLYSFRADFKELPSIHDADQPGCGIERPVQISAILPGLEIAGGAVMRCETARQLALWSRDHLKPAARLLPEAARLTVIEPGSTYQCRDVIGNGDGADLSEHATGNAFDIMAFGFSDGTRLEIQPRQDSGEMAEAFQTAVRGAACLYFTTVLGPGANTAHDNHLHFDIKPRKGDWRLCQ